MSYLAYTYLIKCPNGKSYYGYRAANKTSPEDDLWKHYFTSSKVIQELREQYSDDEFIATIDKTFETAEEAYEYETKFLTENDCVKSDDWLNQQCFPVFQDNTGREFSEETKRKISESRKGQKNRLGRKHTEETKRKISEALKGQKNSLGRKHTEETKRKISESRKGQKNSLGRKHTEETKKKISEAKKGNNNCWGRKLTEETKRKISEARRGQRLSEEHKRKLSESQKGRKHTEETKKKMREAAARRRKNKQKD
jgi:hypothetical protein